METKMVNIRENFKRQQDIFINKLLVFRGQNNCHESDIKNIACALTENKEFVYTSIIQIPETEKMGFSDIDLRLSDIIFRCGQSTSGERKLELQYKLPNNRTIRINFYYDSIVNLIKPDYFRYLFYYNCLMANREMLKQKYEIDKKNFLSTI